MIIIAGIGIAALAGSRCFVEQPGNPSRVRCNMTKRLQLPGRVSRYESEKLASSRTGAARASSTVCHGPGPTVNGNYVTHDATGGSKSPSRVLSTRLKRGRQKK